MKFWPGVLALVLGYSLVAVAQRRPAVVEAIEKRSEPQWALTSGGPCDTRARKLDAERFEALKRVALLRGALKKAKAQMLESWPAGPPENHYDYPTWETLGAALAADDRLSGVK